MGPGPAQCGGSATRREILAALEREMASRFGDLDRAVLPSGMPRWEARVGKARQRLVRRGLLRNDSSRGVWELSEGVVRRAGEPIASVAPG